MRTVLTYSLLLIGVARFAVATEQPAQFNHEAVPLALALDQLSAAIQLPLTYQSDLVEDLFVTAQCEACTVDEALQRLLQGTGLDHQRFGEQIVLRRQPVKLGSVTGRIIDHQEKPLVDLEVTLDRPAHLSKMPVATTVTDKTGHFVFQGLKPGKYQVVVSSPDYVHKSVDVEVLPGQKAKPVQLALELLSIPMEEVVVRPLVPGNFGTNQRREVYRQQPMIAGVQGQNNAAFRRLTRFPGVAAQDWSSSDVNIQGGAADETAVYLDGALIESPSQNLFQKQGVLDLIDEEAISEMRLIDGAPPVEYGDRMGAVLAMATGLPQRELEASVSLSMLDQKIKTAGRFNGDQGSWFFNVRRGSWAMADRFRRMPRNGGKRVNTQENMLGKVQYALNDTHFVSLHMLHGESDYSLKEEAWGESFSETASSEANRTYWLNLKSFWNASLQSETVVARSNYHGRAEAEANFSNFFFRDTFDSRRYQRTSLRQDWCFYRDRHQLKWGVDAQSSRGSFDLFDEAVYPDGTVIQPTQKFQGEQHERPDEDGNGSTAGDGLVHERALNASSKGYGFYLGDRMDVSDRLVGELALRYDTQSHTVDHQWSPRVNFLYRLDNDNTLNLNWGQFYQSQALYQLDFSQREGTYSPAERSEHLVLGYSGQLPKYELVFEAEAYRKAYSSLRGRSIIFNGNYLPPDFFINGGPALMPEGGMAHGLELRLSRSKQALNWSMNYTLSKAEDRVDGHSVPRFWDQRHAVFAQLGYQFKNGYQVSGAWTWHTGWPTTDVRLVTVANEQGQPRPRLEFGPLNGEQLPNYQRLDVRIEQFSRVAKRSHFSWFFEITNVLNRVNATHQTFKVIEENGGFRLDTSPTNWDSRLPMMGFKIDF